MADPCGPHRQQPGALLRGVGRPAGRPENGERKTENGTPLRGDGRGGGRMWRVYAARLSQRTQRTTKVHKGLPEWITLEKFSLHPRHVRWTCQQARRGGPCVRQGARPARGPERAWRASHATLWGGALTRHFTVPKRLERRLSAKRRAAGAVSGGAAERPMEPEAVRASPCVFAENFTEGHWDAPTGDAGDSGAPLRGDG